MYEYLDKINNISDIKQLSEEELYLLGDDIRKFLIANVSETGGHLASNLGIVELTLSILNNFNFDSDKIIFDVGHQCYPYKILTGRKEKFNTLRQLGGISGFPKRAESVYDFYDTGHSSNSISAALGMAKARDIQIKDYNVIAVIGDGALTGGMAYEGLNDLGFSKTKMIVVLNDNQMSISSNVGGLSEYLSRIRINSAYNKLKKKILYRLDHKDKTISFIRKIKNSLKALLIPSMFFDDLGVKYIGPIDGHNINELNTIFEKVKKLEEPVVIHIITKKGKGYKFAEEEPDKFHGVSAFDVATGKVTGKKSLTYSSAFGDSMIRIAEKNKSVVAITAAMTSGTGLSKFAEKFPNRFFDVGIAEQHAVSFAAGLATQGIKPVFAVYSSFLQRGFDQIIHDVCMQNLPVVFAIDRGGLVGNDGETHQGVFDLSYLSMIPNLTILAPKCVNEMEAILNFALKLNRPVAIRYPRGGDLCEVKPNLNFIEHTWEVVSKGEKVAFVATGKMVQYAILAKKQLKELKISPMVVNATSIKPIDTAMVKRLVRENYNIIAMEDNVAIGGFGSLLLKSLNNVGYRGKFRMLAFKDKFIEHGNTEELMKQEKMDVDSIVKIARKMR